VSRKSVIKISNDIIASLSLDKRIKLWKVNGDNYLCFKTITIKGLVYKLFLFINDNLACSTLNGDTYC
jgi:hypothetical protein